MESTVVIKVKYGTTLRRFNAAVNENQQMELDIEGLRAKIRSLFNFPASAALELTYEDEDTDIVALVDQADLHDVLKQGLNPVRITVHLKTESAPSVRSSGTSTPVPAQEQNLNSNVIPGLADFLKSVPKPLREPLSKFSAEVTSNSNPLLSNLIDSFTKLGQSFNAPHPSQSAPDNVVGATLMASESLNGPLLKVASASAPEKKRVTQGSSSGLCTCNPKKSKHLTDKYKKEHLRTPAARFRHLAESFHAKGPSCKGTNDSAASETKNNPSVNATGLNCIKPPNGCPFSGIPIPPFTKSMSFGHSEGSIFHRGVQCDGCDVVPITGPRFKSKVKENYDLCHICFEQMGKESDYMRIDYPSPYRHPWFSKTPPFVPTPVSYIPKPVRSKLDSRFIMDVNVMDGTILAPKTPFTKIWRMRNNGNLPWTHGTQLLWVGGDKISPTDSVELQVPLAGFYPEKEVDIAVDFIAPDLPGRYISYWKMASASGQKFGQRVWVLIQVDASLSEVTPLNLNLPPVGAGDNLPDDLEIGEPETTPLVNMEYERPTVESNEQQKISIPGGYLLYDPVDGTYTSSSTAPPTHMPEPMLSSQTAVPSPFPFHITSSSSAPPLQIPPPSSPFLYPNLADLTGHVPVSATSSQMADTSSQREESTAASSTQQQTDVKNDIEQVLLKELEDMGFKQVDLNLKVLRKNDYNVEKSLDELCNVSDWDLLLEELHGMGFVDGEVNKRVLAKNNGSLKHAVIDLITHENRV